MDTILSGVLVLGGIGFFAALILYYVAQKFAVKDDMRVVKIERILPGVNCGGCGKAGCHDFATACAKANAEELDKLYCTVGGNKLMKEIADIMGYTITEKEPTIAVLRCQGSCQNAPIKFEFTG